MLLPPYIIGTQFLAWALLLALCATFLLLRILPLPSNLPPQLLHRKSSDQTRFWLKIQNNSNNTNSTRGWKRFKMLFFFWNMQKSHWEGYLTMNCSNNTVEDELIIGILRHCCLQYHVWGRTTPTFCYFKHSVDESSLQYSPICSELFDQQIYLASSGKPT